MRLDFPLRVYVSMSLSDFEEEKSETKTRAKNRAKQTLVTLTSQVHVNRDVNLFTEVQTGEP